MSGKLAQPTSGQPASHREAGADRGDTCEGRRKTKILLVDHCPATRVGMEHFLQEGGDAEVVGEASGAEEALRLSDELCPDLVILDTDLGTEMEGLRTCKELKASANAPRVVFYTMRNSEEDVAAASLAGGDGYLHKGTEPERVREAVGRASGGERVWLLGPTGTQEPRRLKTLVDEAGLTPKQGEVFALLLERRTNEEIAHELRLSRNTVKTHVSNVLKKLRLGSRREILSPAHPGGRRKIIPLE
jgi:DNA-binding NarL/FixJ family response regulator